MTQAEIIKVVLKNTKPLKFPRGKRLPLYVWPILGVGTDDDAEAERIIRQLDARGIAVIHSWDHNAREKTLAEGLRIGRIQKKLGLRVNINANTPMHQFFNGDPATAHVDEKGEKFFDLSFRDKTKMGCPFRLEARYPVIKEQLEYFVREYKKNGIDIDFIFADWEIDGPIEWNGAWEASKRCVRCRERIGNIEDFSSFQKSLREIRCRMQREVYADMLKSYFPNVLVGNYAVYPNDGYRYWYDWFEEFTEGAPFKGDGRAKYRRWFQEFPLTGYTFAMPVCYTWSPTFKWYDFENPDYRWFYNMLLVATNAGKNTGPETPIITFVHWNTVPIPKDPKPQVEQFSEENYREFLWHMFLRGHDGLFVWCPRSQVAQEARLAHEVFAAALEYREYLDKGKPVAFDVPDKLGPVVSALRLGDKLLVRRTDFSADKAPVTLKLEGRSVEVGCLKGQCQILSIR